MWSRGDEILMRYGRDGRIYGARPLTVVEHRPDLLAAWLAPATPLVRPVLANGAEIRSVPVAQRYSAGRKAIEDTWAGTGILKLVPAGAAHSIWLFWEPGWRFRGWYVNFEARHRFWARGLDTRDLVLDLWVTEPRRWEWKDLDEFDDACAAGAIDPELAGAVLREAERVVEQVEAWEPPFSEGWESFRPDPAWPLPALPSDWESPH
jgi:hypothetical protein